MQRGDIERDRWAYLVAITPDSRAAYVLAWAASEDPGATIEDVQLETDARVQFWIAELSLRAEKRRLFARSMLLADRPWTRHWIVHWLILLLIVALSIAQFGLASVLPLSLVGAAMVLIPLAPWRSRRRHLWGYWRALELGFCPGCGYDLSGISDFEVRGAVLHGVGPERCPECGAPWPLVPPPVP